MSIPCFQHDSYRRDCGDCRDMNGDDLPPMPTNSPTGTIEQVIEPGTQVRCLADKCPKQWAEDWRGWTGYVAGVHYEPGAGLNYTVCDNWPPQSNGDLSDGFREGQLEALSRKTEPMVTEAERRQAHWAKWPNGDAGDALDYALDHIDDPYKRTDFLDTWRSAAGDDNDLGEWPEYFRWLNTQRKGAATAKDADNAE